MVLGFKRTKMFVSFLAIFHLKDFHEKFLTGVQDQNLLFTFLTNDYEAKFRQIDFSESVRISHWQHLPPKFFQYLLLLYAWDLSMSRLTCNGILRFVYADFTSSERLSVRRNLLGILNILSYSTSVIFILVLSGKLTLARLQNPLAPDYWT